MADIGNSYVNATGQKEDLLDKMLIVTQDKTPMVTMMRTSKMYNETQTWVSERIATPGSNVALVEGADAADSVPGAYDSSSNISQIIGVSYKISGTVNAIRYAGGESYLATQKKIALKQVAVDLDYAILNSTGNTGTSGTASTDARQMYGLAHWSTNNTAATGTLAGTDWAGSASTNGESILNDVLETLYEQGAMPNTAVVSGSNKRKLSSMSALGATRNIATSNNTVSNTITMYESDFGDIKLVMDTQCGDTNMYLGNIDVTSIMYLRKLQSFPLAKVGDSDRFQVLLEASLRPGDPFAWGVVILS